MEQCQFAWLAGEFAGRTQLIQVLRHRAKLGRRGFVLKQDHGECIRGDFLKSLGNQKGFHMFLSVGYSLRWRPTAALASAFISRSRSLSRLSCSFLPRPTASSILISPVLRYSLVGT